MNPGHANAHGSGDTPLSVDPVAGRGGAVLRDVAVHREPRALARPGANAVAHPPPHLDREQAHAPAGEHVDEAPAPSGGVEPEPSAPPEPTPYQQGYEAGLATAEAARQSESDAARERAQRAGFEQGLREGREEGLAEGREAGQQAAARAARAAEERAGERIARLDALLSALPAELARRVASAEDDVVALCHEVVCRIVGDQLVTRDGVTHAVRRAVRESCGGSTLDASGHALLAIHVHPRDLECLQGDAVLEASLRQSYLSASGTVRWVADERIGMGGCMVCTSEGSLDARLDTQMAALRQLLLQDRSPEPVAPSERVG